MAKTAKGSATDMDLAFTLDCIRFRLLEIPRAHPNRAKVFTLLRQAAARYARLGGDDDDAEAWLRRQLEGLA